MLSVVFNISSYVWKILTAIGVTSHSTSAYWDARLFMPLTEGMLVLPVAIVVSVWMDVAKSSLSRSKVTHVLNVQLRTPRVSSNMSDPFTAESQAYTHKEYTSRLRCSRGVTNVPVL